MVLRVAAFVVVWSLYFTVSEYASSIHNDMAEAYAWGREFELGYNQHPPFWAWICGLWFLVFPRTNAAFAVLSMLNAGVGLLGAWALIGRFADGDRRVASTALLALTPFYSFLAYKYNANSIFLSIWPWTLYAFVGSLRGRGLADSLGFGAMMGMALDSKYYALVLAGSCLIAALASRERARYFRSLSPYISIGVAALLFAPHLLWLMTSGAPPIRYLTRVSGRSFAETSLFATTAVVGAVLQQMVAIGLVIAAARIPHRPWRRATRIAANEECQSSQGELLQEGSDQSAHDRSSAQQAERRGLLTIFAVAPLGLSVIAALLLRTKISSNMFIGVFPLTPLLAIEFIGPIDVAKLRRWSMRGALIVSLAALGLSPLVAVGKSWYGSDSEDWEPRREAAFAATTVWRRTTDAPLAFVAGSFRYDNAAAFYSPEHPSVFVGFDYFGNRWVNAEKLEARGLLTICLKADVVCLDRTAAFITPAAVKQEMTLAHNAFGRSRRAVDFVITAIPPR